MKQSIPKILTFFKGSHGIVAWLYLLQIRLKSKWKIRQTRKKLQRLPLRNET